MIQKILYKFNENNLYRDFLSSNIFLFSKIKRLIKFLYKITCISFGKKIEIKKLVDKKEVIQKLVFHGEYYSLPEKLDINNRKFKYLPFGKYDIPEYSIYILDDGLIKAGTNCIFSKNGIFEDVCNNGVVFLTILLIISIIPYPCKIHLLFKILIESCCL